MIDRTVTIVVVTCLVASVLPGVAGEITGFTLINARTNRPIGPLRDGQTVDLSKLGRDLNVRAEVAGKVASVRFALDGKRGYRTENAAPFALGGDSGGNYGSWTPALGKHTISATPYAQRGAKGAAGKTRTIIFTVIEKPPPLDVEGIADLPDPSSDICPPAPVQGDPKPFTATGPPPMPINEQEVLTTNTTLVANAVVSGELKVWHNVTVTLNGPASSEDAKCNPFTDMRLTVTFSDGKRKSVVPGYFAADGKAAQTGAKAGSTWRVHFVPDKPGQWTYKASFRTGPRVAISADPAAGKPGALDGVAGQFTVRPSDKTGRDFRARGMLRYVKTRYLQFAGSKTYYIKGGADSPENFLGYADFDGTARLAKGGRNRRGEASVKNLHRYAPHVKDWRPGDPTWRDGKGKGIIGAINYLAAQGMNSVYFIPYNIDGGDGKDVWPWTDPRERMRFDCSKLDQWEMVFSHMDAQGVAMHIITQETENDQGLDGGALGPQRKLYYRELIARFGHHLAVTWNLGEENTNTDAQRKAFCTYIRALDPYDHPIVVHTYPGKYDRVYTPLLGCEHFEGPSLQIGKMTATHSETLKWVTRSAGTTRPWVVCLDEIGPANTGVKPDKDDPRHDEVRVHALWGNLMAGGAGCEWYFGYKFAHNDLTCEDWRSRQIMWDQTRHALAFFREHLPFAEMTPADDLVSGAKGWCLAKAGSVYVVYLPAGGQAALKLPPGAFTVQWYNPRKGGPLQTGSVPRVTGANVMSLGTPPAEANKDWAILVKATGS